MDWTDEAIIRIRQLWNEGLSTAEIGRRLGVSKNAVVGKVHRLELPGRPSPIRRDPSGSPAAHGARRAQSPSAPATPRHVSGPTLPSFAAAPAASVTTKPQNTVPADATRPTRPSLVSTSPAPIRLSPRTPACCWPIGEPGTPSFRFCNDPALANKPYCAPHAEIAYVRVRDRREDVA